MAAVVTELRGSRSGRKGLRGLQEQVRIFEVNPADDYATYGSPADAVNHPSIPREGDTYTSNGTVYIAQDVRYYWRGQGDNGCTIVEVLYTPPSGTLITLPPDIPRRRWGVQKGTTRRYFDLDKKPIGYPYYLRPGFFLNPDGSPNEPTAIPNPNAELGADVEYSFLTLDITMPPPIKLVSYLPQLVTMLDTVNSDFFEGAEPGQCYYMGFQADEIGPDEGAYAVTHSFRMGAPRLVATGTQSLTLGLDEVVFTHMQVSLKANPNANEPAIEIPAVWSPGLGETDPFAMFPRRRVYERTNHNDILAMR